MTTDASSAPAVAKPLSLGVIFLTLIIDLVGFSIIFPLFPAMLDYYLGREGHGGLLGWLLGQVEALAALAGADHRFTPVLFGGLLGSLYSLLQFLTAPAWGRLSDRIGRRPVLLLSVAGTAVSYLLWFFAGSFWLLLVARLAGGLMSGNLSVATAAVADVTSRENRARGMGLIGAAFGLGFIIGPGLGGLASTHDFLARHPHLAGYGVNPFSTAALIAFLCCLGNLGWIYARFRETLTPAAQAEAAAVPRVRHPLKALFAIADGRVRRANLLYYLFALSFSAVEFSLTFVAAERYAYTPRQMTALFLFLGAGSIVTQGVLVRRLVPRLGERRVLLAGLGFMLAALFTLGFAATPPVFYAGLVALSLGSGFTNATISALISLYGGAGEQGQVLGVFRSLGSLARAVGPIGGGFFYWWLGSRFLYALGGALLLAPLALGLRLPQPEK